MQMLEHKESIIRDIARVYRIPLHLIIGTGGDSQTYQNVESAGIDFVRHTLIPWLTRIENLLTELLPPEVYARFDTEELMRGDMITRVRAQQVQIMSGTLTPNEARHQLGLEPYSGGDDFVMALPGAPMANPTNDTQLGVDQEPPV
jgi:HK97 family phage portal protein